MGFLMKELHFFLKVGNDGKIAAASWTIDKIS